MDNETDQIVAELREIKVTLRLLFAAALQITSEMKKTEGAPAASWGDALTDACVMIRNERP
jgi:hypothetical protein